MSPFQIGAAVAVLAGAVLLYFWLTRGTSDADKQRYVSNNGASKTKKKSFVKPSVLKDYTVQEVALHNTADDLWLIIKDKVVARASVALRILHMFIRFVLCVFAGL